MVRIGTDSQIYAHELILVTLALLDSIHVYNCNDNIRIKKNKIKVQLSSAVGCIM